MTRLTAMSYNIRNAHPDPGHAWADRLPVLLDVVRRADPDVLGMQEVLKGQLDDITAGLPGYDAVSEGRDGDGAGEHGPVLFRRDRFERLDDGRFWLSGTPDVPASNDWGGLFTRMLTWVRLRDRRDGTVLVIASTHLDHDPSAHGDEVRRRSAELIAGRLGALDEPVILLGDFNDVPGSAAHRGLADGGLADAWSGPGGGSFHDYGREAGPRRIDWVLLAGVVADGVRVDTEPDALVASDHYPVIADLVTPSS